MSQGSRKKKKKAVVKSKSTSASKSTQQRWPLQRNVLFKPERSAYVRKLDKGPHCVFCYSAEHSMSLETLCIYKTQYSQMVLNKYPYNSGHLLVLPLRHCGDILSLTEAERKDLFETTVVGFELLQEIYAPTGINMGMNHGATAGAGIPDHLHVHIIPRWAGDLNFFPLIAETKVVIEGLEITYEKMRKYILHRFGEKK